MQRDLLRAAERGDVDAMRAVVEAVAAQYRIKLDVRTTMPDGAAAFFIYRTNTAVIPPIEDASAFAIALHEIGHGIAGPCREREPHRRDLTVREWWHCAQCEVDAWTCALLSFAFGREMFQRLQRSLRHYRAITPAPAAAVHALDATCGTLAWKSSIQEHRARQWRAEWMDSINREVALDKLKSRRQDDLENLARAQRLFPEKFAGSEP